ncbi:MAG TPA: (2Fe-2S)-binding protein [Myxococcota bacterium]|nr:(2Fe-2S)-binding protein [Myxococcota bacterium]HQK51620.1 (2Fe-2S)-binding protein [Myxococcota bacterium]
MRIHVNGEVHEVPDEMADRKLVDFLREDLDLTGTKVGCGIGMCGSCTVLVDGQVKRACLLTLGTIHGRQVTTIEGLAPREGLLHPVQQAFVDAGAIQCGFCTPGMVMAAWGLLLRNPRPTRAQVREALKGNLCRCTGYRQIIDAVMDAARRLAADRGEADEEDGHDGTIA